MKLRKFIRGGKFYFQMLNDDGGIVLESQAYQSKDDRDNGIESVKNNIGNPERYSRLTEDGNSYFILKAGNNQEIARSEAYTDEAALNAAMEYAQQSRSGGSAAATPAPQADGGEAYGTDGKDDDYKPIRFYETNGSGVASGFDSFAAEGESYFSYSLDSIVYLISEGYKSDAARDNGISSVERNMGNEDRYQRQVHPNGKHYFNLRAGNNQEIATSRWFDSEGDMNAIISRLSGRGAGAGEDALVAANKVASVSVAPPPEATGPAAPRKKRKKRSTEKKPKAEKVYLSSGNYHFNNVSYQLFRSGNDKHYFTFKNADGKTILLNSDVRGFNTPEEGQAKIDQVLKYAPTESNYEGKTTKNGKYYFYLKGDEGKNIAKSFFFNTQEDMQVAIGSLLGNVGDAPVATPAPAAEAAPAKKEAPAEKATTSDRKDDDYLACKIYTEHYGHGHDGFGDFCKFEYEGEYFFAWVGRGDIIMRSERYTTASARDNGIASVKKNREIEERYSIDEKMGYFFTVLKAGNHQEISRSCPYKDKESAMYWWPGSIKKRAEEADAKHAAIMVAANAAAAAAPPAPEPEPEPPAPKPATQSSERKDDDYLACKVYREYYGHGHDGLGDFCKFEHEGEYYFAWVGQGDIILRSEGYTTEKARDNGIASVKKNREIEERFSIEEKVGHFFTVLKAGNHQEIGRSCPYKDKDAAMYWWPGSIQKRAEAAAAKEAEVAKAAAAAAAAAPPAPEPDPEPVPAPKPERKDDDYLACKEYEAHMNDKSGKHDDFIAFEKEGEYFFAWVADGKIVMRSERYTSAAARDNGIESVIKNREIEKRFSIDEKMGHFFTVLKAGNHQEIARSCPHKDKGAAMYWYPGEVKKREEEAAKLAAVAVAAAPVATKSVKRDDDYLHCKYYKGHARSEKYPDFSLFEEDGEYYFAMLDGDDEVVLRSEGYKSEKGRTNGIKSVIKNRDIEGRYSTDEKGGMYYVVLKAGNNQEIGRSCPYKEKSRALGFIAPVAAVAAAAAIPDPEPKAAPQDKEDDYLSCKEYQGRKVNDKVNNVALFKHDGDGQFYFALYDGDGEVKLRSEGFRTAKERDQELAGVLKYHEDKDMYKRKEKGVYYMDILYDKTGREVGRSCLQKKVAAAAPVAAAAATAAAAAVVAPKVEPKKVVAPVKEKVAAAPVATSGGGSNWWKWLIPLLLLGALAWFLTKGCGDTPTPTPPPPPKVEAPAPKPEPVAETPPPAPTPAAPAPVVAGCTCDQKNIAIFKIPTGPAKSVAKLGTYPEFGNSHGLSPTQFYQKLSDRYSNNAVDKAYLDYVYRSMGYRNGFAGASASQFSNVTLDRGQKGLLGLGAQHHYEYSALNTNERDRQAFKIKAANGCDVHFMKTCGNYMFFCD